MFLKQAWYVAAHSAELGRQPLGRTIAGEPIVLYRKADGGAVALEDRCCHRRAPLHLGKLVGDDLQCGYHGFTFAADGACVAVPGHERVPFKGVGVKSYPVIERHGYAWLWLGAAGAADPALIPDLHENHDPGWAVTGGLLPVKADYLLLVENLLDLSHVAFVHSATIGSDDSGATLDFERLPGALRIVRTADNIVTPPHMRQIGIGERGNMKKTMRFDPPCSIWIEILWTNAAGRSWRAAVINSITPERDGACHYFWAHARDFDRDSAATTAFFAREVIRAFNEDKTILEAQQSTIELDPAAPTVSVHGDWGAVQARRLVAQLIAAETARGAAAE